MRRGCIPRSRGGLKRGVVLGRHRWRPFFTRRRREAAFRDGAAWRVQLLDTLRGNAARIEQVVSTLPGLSMERVEATFLAWIDCRDLGVEHPAALFEKAGVGLSDGVAFGPGQAYAQYVRLNFGTPRALLDTALERIKQACTSL